MLRVLTDDELLAEVSKYSYRNFHAKGLDYICLRRSPELTVKVYFFDGPTIEVSEVICPHDHRYDFGSGVLAGELWNATWREQRDLPPESAFDPHRGKIYNRFEFHTPLNGGNGFTWEKEVALTKIGQCPYSPGARYSTGFKEIHTLAHVQPSTVLMLWQYQDVMPIDEASHTYSLNNEPPSLSGLYEKHTPDSIIARLKQLEQLRPGICNQHGLARFVKED